MQTEIRRAVDGRVLVSARFPLAVPNDSEPELEAVFSLHWPQDFTRTSNPIGIVLLSVTRTDTRETVRLNPKSLSEVIEAVTLAADDYDKSLYT